jgi:hypothetical protein
MALAWSLVQNNSHVLLQHNIVRNRLCLQTNKLNRLSAVVAWIVSKHAVSWIVTPCSSERAQYFKGISCSLRAAWCYNPGDHTLHSDSCGNLKSHIQLSRYSISIVTTQMAHLSAAGK